MASRLSPTGWSSASTTRSHGFESRAAERQLDVPAIDGAVRARATARLTRDFDTADRLHRELLALGVVVVDDGDGSDWTLTADQGPLTGGAGR